MRMPRWPVVLGAIFVVGLLWRLLYLQRLATSPLESSLSEDSLIYWRWSGFLIQHGFWGKNAFFMGPLYPYALALLRPLVGDSIQGILFVQAVWGAASAALLADATRRLTRPVTGLIAGLVVATYEMAVFFDGLILMESLLFFLESLLLWWVIRTNWSAHRTIPLLVLGGLLGLLAEGRASSALLILPAILVLAFTREAARLQQMRSGVLILAGFTLIVLPGAIRNYQVSGEWIPFTYNGGFNLYIGNHEEATGGFARVTGTHVVGSAVGGGEDGGVEGDARDYLREVENLDLSPAASSAYWTRKAWRFISTHPDRAIQLAIRKMVMMWNRREYPQIENVDEFRGMAGPVGLPLVGTFAFVGALSLAGLIVAWGRGPAGRFLIGYVVVMTVAVAPFFVTDRYRHHLVPAAVILAGLCIDHLAIAWWQDRIKVQGRLIAATLAGLVMVNLPAPQLGRAKYAWGLAYDLGTRWAERGRVDLAISEYEKAIRMEQGITVNASDRGDLYYSYANALLRSDRRREALEWYERAVRAAPDHGLAIRALAEAQASAGSASSAESLFSALESKAGGELLAAEGRARVAASQGRLEEAEALFREIVRKQPSHPFAWGALIRVQVQAGDVKRAAETLEEARREGLAGPELRAHQALLAAMTGDRKSAEAALADVPEEAIARDPALADVVAVVRRLLARP